MEHKKKWYQKTGTIILLLILFFPAGLYLMWKHAEWSRNVKWVVTGFFALLIIGNAASGGNASKSASVQPQQAKATEAPKPTDKPQEASLKIGDDGIINNQDNVKNCEGIALVGATKDDLDRLVKLSVAKDSVGIGQMVLDGKAYIVKNCTKVKLIGATFTTREIRIMDGDNFGKSGFTPFEFIRKL